MGSRRSAAKAAVGSGGGADGSKLFRWSNTMNAHETSFLDGGDGLRGMYEIYQRPQFVRRRWQSLNGEWEFAFDDSDQGLAQGWATQRKLEKRIIVPFAYQTELSRINDKSIHEVLWYARDFEVPKEWAGQDVLLHFGAVDYRTIVWVNGHEVGHNRGGHVPFSFNIRPYLRDGTNRMTLRVED